MSRVIGIDLGTTNSVVAVMDGPEPRVITNAEGGRSTPSVVGFTETGDVLVGQVARRQAVVNPETTVSSVKRFMGMSFADVESECEFVSYEVCEADNGDAAIRIRGRRYSPQEISAKVLAKLKREAEAYLGEPVTDAVITVPAYFNDAQRKATKDAGAIAGLTVRRLVNEPTAAALAYNASAREDQLIVVYDFGGGTLDVSLLEVGDDVVEVKATAGDTHLGGDDIDRLIVRYLSEEFHKDTGIDVSGDRMVVQRLYDAAEKSKIELSSTVETDVNLPFLSADQSGPKHLNIRLSRAKLEYLIDELVQKTLGLCGRVLSDAGVAASDVDDVILVGGSTRIPLVQQEVERFFGRKPNGGVNPDEVVAVGAALQGGIITGEVKDLLLLDVTALSLGVKTRGDIMARLIDRNTTIPVKRGKVFTTAVDNQRQVEIEVLQGEREFASDNVSLGRFTLDEIPPALRSVPKIAVEFNIDANGIVNVTATEQQSGRSQQITVHPSGGLSDGDIRRMVEEAAQAEAHDVERRRRIQGRNRLEGLVLGGVRRLAEVGDHGPPELREEVETAGRLGAEILADQGADLDTIRGGADRIADGLAALADALEQQRAAERVAEEQSTADGAAEDGAAEEPVAEDAPAAPDGVDEDAPAAPDGVDEDNQGG
jgi:molecular chaperone DnaK